MEGVFHIQCLRGGCDVALCADAAVPDLFRCAGLWPFSSRCVGALWFYLRGKNLQSGFLALLLLSASAGKCSVLFAAAALGYSAIRAKLSFQSFLSAGASLCGAHDLRHEYVRLQAAATLAMPRCLMSGATLLP